MVGSETRSFAALRMTREQIPVPMTRERMQVLSCRLSRRNVLSRRTFGLLHQPGGEEPVQQIVEVFLELGRGDVELRQQAVADGAGVVGFLQQFPDAQAD